MSARAPRGFSPRAPRDGCPGARDQCTASVNSVAACALVRRDEHQQHAEHDSQSATRSGLEARPLIRPLGRTAPTGFAGGVDQVALRAVAGDPHGPAAPNAGAGGRAGRRGLRWPGSRCIVLGGSISRPAPVAMSHPARVATSHPAQGAPGWRTRPESGRGHPISSDEPERPALGGHMPTIGHGPVRERSPPSLPARRPPRVRLGAPKHRLGASIRPLSRAYGVALAGSRERAALRGVRLAPTTLSPLPVARLTGRRGNSACYGDLIRFQDGTACPFVRKIRFETRAFLARGAGRAVSARRSPAAGGESSQRAIPGSSQRAIPAAAGASHPEQRPERAIPGSSSEPPRAAADGPPGRNPSRGSPTTEVC